MRALLPVVAALSLLSACNKSGGRDPFIQPRFDFGRSTADVDNPYFPLEPGARWVALTPPNEELGINFSTIHETQVSHFPLLVAGSETREVITRSYRLGDLVEERREFFVQDEVGHVFILGAEVLQYDDGSIDGDDGTWVLEFDEDRQDLPLLEPELIMSANPRVGDEFIRRVGLQNRRVEVVDLDATVDSEAGRFTGCLQVRQISNLGDPTLWISSAPGIGAIRAEDEEGTAFRDLLSVGSDRNPLILPEDFVVGVNHPFFPLNPGTTLVYGGNLESGERIDRLVQTQFTREEVIGVDCTVNLVTEMFEGQVIFEARDYYAQDEDGSVWQFGREIVLFDEEGEPTEDTTGSWRAGVAGAQPGVRLPAMPMLHDSYRRGFAPGLEERVVKVTDLASLVETPVQTFFGCIETFERDALQPADAPDIKRYYAGGVGPVLSVDDEDLEPIPLVEIR